MFTSLSQNGRRCARCLLSTLPCPSTCCRTVCAFWAATSTHPFFGSCSSYEYRCPSLTLCLTLCLTVTLALALSLAALPCSNPEPFVLALLHHVLLRILLRVVQVLDPHLHVLGLQLHGLVRGSTDSVRCSTDWRM